MIEIQNSEVYKYSVCVAVSVVLKWIIILELCRKQWTVWFTNPRWWSAKIVEGCLHANTRKHTAIIVCILGLFKSIAKNSCNLFYIFRPLIGMSYKVITSNQTNISNIFCTTYCLKAFTSYSQETYLKTAFEFSWTQFNIYLGVQGFL